MLTPQRLRAAAALLLAAARFAEAMNSTEKQIPSVPVTADVVERRQEQLREAKTETADTPPPVPAASHTSIVGDVAKARQTQSQPEKAAPAAKTAGNQPFQTQIDTTYVRADKAPTEVIVTKTEIKTVKTRFGEFWI